MHPFEIGGAESVVPDRRGGIACITRPGAIVFCEKFLANMELAAHLLQAWMCKCHAERLLAHLRSSGCMLKQSALSRFDK